jgi:hypothetical protein
MKQLNIKRKNKMNYYDMNFQEYIEKTKDVDMTKARDSFLHNLCKH